MPEDESIEWVCRRIRALSRNEVVRIGSLPAGVISHWLGLQSFEVVVTGPQWAHILARHPEIDALLEEFVDAARAPDEIYTDSEHPDSVTLWKMLDKDGDHWLRITLSLATSDKSALFHNSIITSRKSRRRGYEREIQIEKRLWSKGKA